MPARGLIKIMPGGGTGGLGFAIIDVNDFLAEMAPQVGGVLNWLQGAASQEVTADQQRDWQRQSAYLAGGYSLYADSLEVMYHNVGTQQYNGMGANGSVATNAESFREVKFTTQVTQRDPDLPDALTDVTRRGSWNPLDYVGAIIQNALDSATGVQQLKAFYKKRAEFLRDLDDVEVEVTSVMFNPIKKAYITSSSMKMEGGRTEAFFDVTIKETSELKAPDPNDNTHAIAEPGTSAGGQ